MAHEHVFTDGWIRGRSVFRACKCGVYDNPYVLESDFPNDTVDNPDDPFAWLTGND